MNRSSIGKLPIGAGWQPALPNPQKFRQTFI